MLQSSFTLHSAGLKGQSRRYGKGIPEERELSGRLKRRIMSLMERIFCEEVVNSQGSEVKFEPEW